MPLRPAFTTGNFLPSEEGNWLGCFWRPAEEEEEEGKEEGEKEEQKDEGKRGWEREGRTRKHKDKDTERLFNIYFFYIDERGNV